MSLQLIQQANIIREDAKNSLLTVEQLSKKYNKSTHTITAYLLGHRCKTNTKPVHLAKLRYSYRQKKARFLYLMGYSRRQISIVLHYCYYVVCDYLSKPIIESEYIPTMSICLTRPISDVNGDIVKGHTFSASPIDSAYSETLLKSKNTSYIVKTSDLIGKIKYE